MEATLRDESERWLREKDRRRRQGEPRGMPHAAIARDLSKDWAGSYEQLANEKRYPGEMDLDDDEFRQPPVRYRDARDSRETRDVRDMEPPRPVGRGSIPVSTLYPPEQPGYPTQYTISSQQPGYPPGQPQHYGVEREPRTFGGNTTPPTSTISRAPQPAGYGLPGYSARTTAPISQAVSAPYDPRSRDIMSGGYPSGYSESRSSRR